MKISDIMAEKHLQPAVFVAHVKTETAREEHVRRALDGEGLAFEFMLDGDIADLTDDFVARTFAGEEMCGKYPATSCFTKHYLIYRQIVSRNLPGALIFEDDFFLHRNFGRVFAQSMAEFSTCSPERPAIVSYEDTRLRFVPRSRRKKGRVLYAGNKDRMAGAYYINRAGAELLCRTVEKGGIRLPIDLLHCALLREGKLDYYWCQPTVVSQGSHNGRFKSGISLGSDSLQALKFRFKRLYKKLLYELR